MNVTFYLAAAAMVILALLLVIVPLIRGGLRQRQRRGLFATALAVGVLLPGAVIGVYPLVGTPAALDDASLRMAPVTENAQPTIAATNLRADPAQEIKKWLDIAQTDDAEHRPSDARDAYGQVLMIDAKNTVAMVGWVEADMAQHTDYEIDTTSRGLLEQAVAQEPDNQRALWLLGISKFQHQDYAAAATTWRHLLGLLDGSSHLAQSVAQQIAIADAKAKTP